MLCACVLCECVCVLCGCVCACVLCECVCACVLCECVGVGERGDKILGKHCDESGQVVFISLMGF